MCGIAGFLAAPGAAIDPTILPTMTRCVAHRGPDDEGYFRDDATGVGLGHRRLSIIDLSPAGHQPMPSASGRFVIVFNGEIYNFRELARDLGGRARTWRGQSDTEVLLAAIEEWGLDAALKRLIGIFAFALWDRETSALSLARDHLGVKPLYYASTPRGLAFASELAPIERFPGFEPRVNRGGVALLMRHNCIPAPYSVYEGVYKLTPGTYLTVRAASAELPSPVAYWSAREVAEAGQRETTTLSDREAVNRLDALLRDAVGLQMTADVPLGAFLSGGIDSSTVVAMMQQQSTRAVRTFSIGFREDGFDEATHARAVARHLGTDHTELYVTARDALDVVPRLPQLYDEPFADSSQIPTVLVSELARRSVTVALSGDGGDELFAGYNRHVYVDRVWKSIRWLPLAARRRASQVVGAVPERHLAGAVRLAAAVGMRCVAPQHVGHYRDKLAEIIRTPTPEHMYRSLTSHWKNSGSLVLSSTEPITRLTDATQWPALSDITNKMMYLDLVTYLPDDILTKVDRASMAVGLEARVPLLDHRVVEFAWTLPLSLKRVAGQGKWILREVLSRYVPPSLTDRPKAGFGIPLASWLRGPLRDWAEALIDPRRLRDEGVFDPGMVAAAWQEHLSGAADRHFELWNVLMFQAWASSRRLVY